MRVAGLNVHILRRVLYITIFILLCCFVVMLFSENDHVSHIVFAGRYNVLAPILFAFDSQHSQHTICSCSRAMLQLCVPSVIHCHCIQYTVRWYTDQQERQEGSWKDGACSCWMFGEKHLIIYADPFYSLQHLHQCCRCSDVFFTICFITHLFL